MGGGRYSVTGTTVSTNLTSARQDAAEQANAFCALSSRQAVIQNFDDFAHGGHWGGPTSSAVFYDNRAPQVASRSFTGRACHREGKLRSTGI